MTYHELIELYKNGKLDDTQKKQVEKDIERQDAISEYLFDQEELPAFADLKENETEDGGSLEETERESETFTRMIQAAIRKTFIKVGVIVGAVVLLIVCFIIFVLPQIVDVFYYDPSETVGTTEYSETNRITLDLSVYSELFLPGTYRDNVDVIGNGNGKYDITVFQSSSWTGTFHHVAGTINKGKMILYDADLLQRPTGNAFLPARDVVVTFYDGVGAAGYKNEAFEALQDLNDSDYYRAYFTLDQVMSYGDFVKWLQENEVEPNWCAICQKNPMYDKEVFQTEYFSEQLIGFIYCSSAWSMCYNEDQYPLLTWYSVSETSSEEEDWVISEDNMKQHMVSMLRYMADGKKFCKMMEMEYSDSDLNALADNIEEYGLNIYGFTVLGQKDEILKTSELDEIEYVYTEPYR